MSTSEAPESMSLRTASLLVSTREKSNVTAAPVSSMNARVVSSIRPPRIVSRCESSTSPGARSTRPSSPSTA